MNNGVLPKEPVAKLALSHIGPISVFVRGVSFIDDEGIKADEAGVEIIFSRPSNSKEQQRFENTGEVETLAISKLNPNKKKVRTHIFLGKEAYQCLRGALELF